MTRRRFNFKQSRLIHDSYLILKENSTFIVLPRITYPSAHLRQSFIKNNVFHFPAKQVKMPFNNDKVQFLGKIYVTKEANNFNQSGSYSIQFNDLSFSFTTKPNFNFGEMLPNNFTQIDITYKNTNVSYQISKLISLSNFLT